MWFNKTIIFLKTIIYNQNLQKPRLQPRCCYNGGLTTAVRTGQRLGNKTTTTNNNNNNNNNNNEQQQQQRTRTNLHMNADR